ncbi:6-phosphofructokinase 1 [Nematocida homosporus]|uniref:6-phosphofructokinase 1 n=1 Tax=Nematocida homosporus TaxID=1912981 RepID=UPI00221EA2D9|nr:6-phosphofructokinase 1 [Nematocida homosporus]KAI5186144.1 6-phosphofructokinase 1 [Nematocida homosporus]
MVKIEFLFPTRVKRSEVRNFYVSLGLKVSMHKKYLRLRNTPETRIVSVTQSHIHLRAENHREILEAHKDHLLYDLETAELEDDVETDHAHRSHHIPFRIKLADPLSNTICIAPALQRKTIAVLTSGGDAPGMNATIWAITRAASKTGASVMGIQNGFAGLLANRMIPLSEELTFQHMHLGGTFLQSAREPKFTEPSGPIEGAKVLKARNIDALIVIGGDGSMRGASVLAKTDPELTVVFVPATIDNDIPGTESLGAASALHRIVEAIDCIEPTMASHRRAFVLEVMGRDCGWLALTAGFATEAAYVFLPEYPQPDGWEKTLATAVAKAGHCAHVILAEGARYRSGKRITAGEVLKALEDLGLEARQVVLGHTQRGGAPCAADRVIAATLGVAAAEVALGSTPGAYALQINNGIERVVDLFTQVDKCQAAAHALGMIDGNIEKARGRGFVDIYKAMMSTGAILTPNPSAIAVSTVGALGAGAAHIIKSLIFHAQTQGKTVHNISTHPYFLRRQPRRTQETDFVFLKEYIEANHPDTLILIGGLDAVAEAKKLEGLCPRIYVIPCTVSNNVPGTATTIGADTALDTITALCDNLKVGANRNVGYIVEVFGGACGYLSIAAALAVGAIDCYFPEETGVLKRLRRSVQLLDKHFETGSGAQLIIRSNGSMKGICSETLARVLEADGSTKYSVRSCQLGHVQKGNLPTAGDRLKAARLALFAAQTTTPGLLIIGLSGQTPSALPIAQAQLEINPAKRRLKKADWLEMARTYRVLN